MPQIDEIIERLSRFMVEEPSGDFHVAGWWNKTFREYELKKMAEFSNEFDASKELTVIYLADFCRHLIENTSCPVSDAIHGTEQLKKYRECYELACSSPVRNCKSAIVEKMAKVVNALSKQKTIGGTEAVEKAVENGIEALFDNFARLKFEVYATSGRPVGALSTTSLSVLSFQSLAECLLRLEKTVDGIYACYISNPGTRDGWFGFFVRSNGNMFSYNERIDEAYIGQHGNMRNGRYTENKAYDLFPYELCEQSDETDYKGYAKEIRLGEKLNLVDGNDFGLVIRMLLCLSVIAGKHCGETVSGEPVIVNSLLPNNLALLAQKGESSGSTALVEWRSSPIVEYTAKSAVPKFDERKVLRGEYNSEFDKLPRCIFSGLRQDVVDAYGEGFKIQQDRILASDSSLRLIGKGECEQEFIGQKKRIQAQAYYDVRKQLCNYIGRKMQKDFKDFGGREGLSKWYAEKISAMKDTVLKHCLECFKKVKEEEGERCVGITYLNSDEKGKDTRFGDAEHPVEAVDVRAYNKVGIDFWGVMMLSQLKDNHHRCWLTGSAASYYFRFSFYSYQQVDAFIGGGLPKFCTGWFSTGTQYCGNDILNMVDPVDRMVTPLSGDHRAFDFIVALSKSAINRLNREAKMKGDC